MGLTTSTAARGDPDWAAVDLSRILDTAFVSSLVRTGTEPAPGSAVDEDSDGILEEIMLSSRLNSDDDVSVVISSLLEQIAASAVVGDGDIARRREILLKNVAAALHRSRSQSVSTPISAAPSNNVPAAEENTPSLPFEALLGVKLFCATLDSVDAKSPVVSAAILESLLPLLSKMPTAAKSSDDIGVLDSISRFLTSTLSSTLHAAYASNAVSALFGLAIARASLADLLAVLERILCGDNHELSLKVAPFLTQLTNTSGPSKPSLVRSLYEGGSRPVIPCGDLYAWGRGENGRLGINSSSKKALPTQVPAFSSQNIREFATFANHALAIDAHDKAYSWGKGDNGRLGHGNASHQLVPKEIAKLAGVPIVSVACGLSHSLLLAANGVVFSMGDGNNGRLGHRSSVPLQEPHPIEAFSNIVISYITCGAYHSIAIEENGTVYSWGKNESGQLGLGHRQDCTVPTVIEAFSQRQIKMIACGWEHNIAVTTQGETFSWGSGYEASRPVLGHGGCTPEVAPRLIAALTGTFVVFVAAGWDHALAITESGGLFSWGEGLSGKLGHGDSNSQELPKPVSTFRDQRVVWADGGADHSVAITADGQIWTWGGGSEFQLGHGSETYSHTPMAVSALTGKSLRCVRAGDKYTMAITGEPLDSGLFGTGGRSLPVAKPPAAHAEEEPSVAEEEDESVLQHLHTNLEDANALLAPIAVAIITLHHLGRLASEQPLDLSKCTTDDLAVSPFCIDVRPVCFSSMMSILHHTIKALSADTGSGPLHWFIMRKTFTILGANLRRLTLLPAAFRDEFNSKFSLSSLHEFLLNLVEHPVSISGHKLKANEIIMSINAQVVDLLQTGLELFYSTCDSKITLARQSILGETESARAIGDSVLLRLAESSLTSQLMPSPSDSTTEFRHKSRELLDLLRLLVMHPGEHRLKFLSSLQAHLLALYAENRAAFADIALDYSRMVLDAAIGLCIPLLDASPSDALEKLKPSVISDICPALVQTLSLLDLCPRLLTQLLSLLNLMDKIAMSITQPKKPFKWGGSDRLLTASGRANHWLFGAVHVIADAISNVLKAQIRTDQKPVSSWLSTPLFQYGLERNSSQASTPRPASPFAVTPEQCRELYDDIIDDQALGGSLWNWISNARRAERVGMPQLWLDRATRAVFAAYLHHQNLGVEAVLYARMLAKNNSRTSPKVPVELIEIWREAQSIRTQIMFNRSAALSANDDAGSGYELFAQPVISKATLLLSLATSIAASSSHVTESISDDDEPGMTEVDVLEQVSDDEDFAGNEKPEWVKVAVQEDKFIRREVRSSRNRWKVLRVLLRTAHKWRRLSRQTLQSAIMQKTSASSSSYAVLRRFFSANDVDLTTLRESLMVQRDRAIERLRGLYHLRRLLALIAVPSVRAKLLLCLPTALNYGSPLTGLDGCAGHLAQRVQHQALAIFNIATKTLQEINEFEGENDAVSQEVVTLGKACLIVLGQRLKDSDHSLIWQSQTIPVLQNLLSLGRSSPVRSLHGLIWKVFRLLSAQLAFSDSRVILDAICIEMERCLSGRDLAHRSRRNSTSNHTGGGVGGWAPVDAQLLLSSAVKVESEQLGFRLPIHSTDSKASGDYTIAFWMRLSAGSSLVSNPEQVVCMRLGSTQVFAPKIVLSRYDRKIQAVVTTSNGNEILTCGASIPFSQWVHVTFTLAKRNASLYVTTSDGPINVQRTLQSSARSPAAAIAPIFIGKALDGSDAVGFDGQICQVVYLRRALPQAEIEQIFAGGRPELDPVDKTSSQLLALLWAIGPSFLLKHNVNHWLDLLQQLLDVGSLGVRIRALRLLRRLLPHIDEDVDSDRTESHRRYILITFLIECAAATLWTWSTASPQRTEHHRLAVADEAIMLLRTLPAASEPLARALDQIPSLLSMLRSSDINPELFESNTLSYALSALSVLGGHQPMLRLGARVRLDNNEIGTICQFHSRSQTMRIVLDHRRPKIPVPYPVRAGTIFDEIAAGPMAAKFRERLVQLSTLVLSDYPASIPEDAELTQLEALVLRGRLSSMLLKIIHILVINANVDNELGDFLPRLLTVGSMPTFSESRLDLQGIETRHQFLWAQLRHGRELHLNPPTDEPSTRAATPLASPASTVAPTEEQILQETKIDHVAAMGFDREFCRVALQNSAWDENAAVEYLLINIEQLEAAKRAADAAISVPRSPSRAVTISSHQQPSLNGLPNIDLTSLEDQSGRETATDIYAERYFADGDRGALHPCAIESYLEVDHIGENTNTAVPVTIGLDDDSHDFGYAETLRNVKELDDALGILFSRQAVIEAFLAPRLSHAALPLRDCALQDPHLLIRFIKLVTFRNRLTSVTEKLLLDNIDALFRNDVTEAKSRRFQDVLLEEFLRHIETAALPDYNSFLWGHRDLSCTDYDALSKPRLELTFWVFTHLIRLPWLTPGVRLLVIERLCRTLRSPNLTLREIVLDILSRFVYTLVDESPEIFVEFAPRYLSSIRSTGLEKLADLRVAFEEDRLIKSRIVSAKICLLATCDTVQRRLLILQSKSQAPRSSTVMAPSTPLLEEVTTDAIEIYWEPCATFEELITPTEYSVEMRSLPSDEFVEVYRGAARAYRATGLTSLTSYEIRVIGCHEHSKSASSPTLTVLTHPVLHWDPHHARASGRAKVKLSNCNLTASFDAGSDKWRTLMATRGYSSGLHRWEIVLDSMSKGYIFLGVATVSANPDTYVGGDAHGFGLFINDRSRYHGRNKIKGGAKYGDQMNVDDIVGVVLDLDKQTLSFTLNGKDLGVAFDELPTDHILFPAVSFYHRGDQVSFGAAAQARRINTHLLSGRDRTARLTRRVGTATEFAWTMLESSSSKATADHFIDIAYAFWLSWCSNDERRLPTTSGEIITVDVSRAACARYGLVHGRVATESGFTGRLLGVCPDSNRIVVIGDSDTDPDLFSPEQILRPNASSVKIPQEDSARAVACKWSLSQFATHISLLPAHLDLVLVKLCNELSDRLGVDPLSLLYDEIAEAASRYPELQDLPAPALCARFAILRTLNYYVAHTLPYLAIARVGAPVNLGALMRKLRHLMLTRIKSTLLNDILHQTMTYTKPSEDPYEDPPDLKQIALNRHSAVKALSGPNALTQSLFGQAFTQIDAMNVRDLRRGFVRMLDDGQERTFKVKFVGEGVTDNGGPYRECFNEFVAELFRDDCALPLFIPTPNAREAQGSHRDWFIPSPTCVRFDLFKFVGKLIGIALRNRIHLNLRLPTLFWLAFVGQHPTRKHLQEIDALLVQLLQEIEKASPEQFDAEQFDYRFECILGDGKTTVELVPGGSQMKLTYANRSDWVRLVEQRRLHEADAQIAAIRSGFASIVPLAAFELFTVEELETLVCGNSDFNISLLQSLTVYESGVSPDDAHVQFFWQVLQDMTPEEKSEFCRFVWARTRLPTRADEFITKFKIQPAPAPAPGQHADQQLPQSHTCFFSLALPPYSSSVILRHKLLYAARNCQTLDRDLKLSDAEIAEIGDI